MADQLQTYNAEAKFTGVIMLPEKLTIVGIDCPDSDCPELADPLRINLPIDPEMTTSIAKNGVRVPISIRKYRGDPRTFVVVGRQRVRHARIVNERLKDDSKVRIKCVPDDTDSLALLAIENDWKQENTAAMKAELAKRMRLRGDDDATIRQNMRVSQATLDEWWAFLDAPAEARVAVLGGNMSVEVAAAIGRTAPAKQAAAIEVAKRHASKGGKVRGAKAVEAVRQVRSGKAAEDVVVHKKLSSGKVRKLLDELKPGSGDDPNDVTNLDLAWRVLRVVSGEGVGVLKDWPDVQKVFRRVLKAREQ